MLIKMTLDNGLNPDSSRTSMLLPPLQHASKVGNIALACLSLGAGADVDSAPSTYLCDSLTPLMPAVQTRKTDLVNLLICVQKQKRKHDVGSGGKIAWMIDATFWKHRFGSQFDFDFGRLLMSTPGIVDGGIVIEFSSRYGLDRIN